MRSSTQEGPPVLESVIVAERGRWREEEGGGGVWVLEEGIEYQLGDGTFAGEASTSAPSTVVAGSSAVAHLGFPRSAASPATSAARPLTPVFGGTTTTSTASSSGSSMLGPATSPNKRPSGTRPLRALVSVRRFKTREVPGLSRSVLALAQAQHGGHDIERMPLGRVLRLAHVLAAARFSRESRRVALKAHQRIALPFACAIFGLLGSLISLRIRRDQKRVGFVLTLTIVFSYYALSVAGGMMGQLGILSPFVGAWLPNAVGFLLALFLLLPLVAMFYQGSGYLVYTKGPSTAR